MKSYFGIGEDGRRGRTGGGGDNTLLQFSLFKLFIDAGHTFFRDNSSLRIFMAHCSDMHVTFYRGPCGVSKSKESASPLACSRFPALDAEGHLWIRRKPVDEEGLHPSGKSRSPVDR